MSRDEVKIRLDSKKGWIYPITNFILRKKIGYDVDVQFLDIHITNDEDKAHVDLNVSAELSMDELARLLKAVGLE